MTRIRLWLSPGACSLAPHILLHEIGADFEAVLTPVSDGAHLTDEFVRLNPKRRVPVLGIDDEVITELPAIVTAISNMKPELLLIGARPYQTVRVYEWMNWLSGTLHGQGFGGFWRPHRFSDDASAHEGIKAKAARTIEECFESIESKLNGPFSTGGSFTAVDPFLLVFYRWGWRIGTDMSQRYPKYSEFARVLMQRPSVSAAFRAEKISLDA